MRGTLGQHYRRPTVDWRQGTGAGGALIWRDSGGKRLFENPAKIDYFLGNAIGQVRADKAPKYFGYIYALIRPKGR